ncbi:MAG: ABC transporter ATP-binding protein [Cyanobacteria bacterium P01_H01_bin.15]
MAAISFENVSLRRRTQEEYSYDFKRSLLALIEGKYRKPPTRQVLTDISFKIQTGERLGLIGSNGAGKSTLLKVICGILTPSNGRVQVRGRIAPLIELGGGFDPDISLADNIVLYGVLLGATRAEMLQRVEPILAFAELEDYALSPVKSLSSGMRARLGFSVVTDKIPNILLLDEVLSVGDAAFRSKCRDRMTDFWDQNTTVVAVSHDLNFLENWCDTGLWLDKGQVRYQGEVKQVRTLFQIALQRAQCAEYRRNCLSFLAPEAGKRKSDLPQQT